MRSHALILSLAVGFATTSLVTSGLPLSAAAETQGLSVRKVDRKYSTEHHRRRYKQRHYRVKKNETHNQRKVHKKDHNKKHYDKRRYRAERYDKKRYFDGRDYQPRRIYRYRDTYQHNPVYNYLPSHCVRIARQLDQSSYQALLYIASYRDLMSAFGRDPHKARQHFKQYGCRQGRHIRFDPQQYIAGYDDLIKAFREAPERGLDHYFTNGFRENRLIDRFCGKAYAVHNPDVSRIIGYHERDLAHHYIRYGYKEYRDKRKFQINC